MVARDAGALAPAELLHETRNRVRFRFAPGIDAEMLRAQLESLPGVKRVRVAPSIRSIAIEFDGRHETHDAVLRVMTPSHPRVARNPDRSIEGERAGTSASLAPAIIAATIPALPVALRPWLALGVVGSRAILSQRLRGEPAALALDSVALATTALTGHPVTAAASVILGTLSERWAQRLTAETDALLERIAAEASSGQADVARAGRLREHIRHAIQRRDQPGRLSPGIERLIALPITGAGLVIALTGDAGRAAAMLQADPQHGLALARPVASEASLYALAREGMLMTGMEAVERLADATTVVFEDVGILSAPAWQVDGIEMHRRSLSAPRVLQWLKRLAHVDDDASGPPAFPDHVVSVWREHGAVLRDGRQVLHFCGSALAERTWGIVLPQPDRRSLMRRIAVVADGELLAVARFVSPLRTGLARQFARLRASGFKRIAIFTEDPAAQPAHALRALGADEIVCVDRASQGHWLAEAALRGERLALVHTGLRDLLPPGGLSLCPIDAESGAHGVLLGAPLDSLLAGRRLAMRIRRRLLRHYALAIAVNGALMGASVLRLAPPIATATLHHAFAFFLLQDSLRLARRARAVAASPTEELNHGMD
jgi:cation transport ATPase